VRILVTGSREFGDLAAVRRTLAEVTTGRRRPHTVVHGAARGADHLAGVAARLAGWTVEGHAAAWSAPCLPDCRPGCRRTRRDGTTYCSAAGHYRNQHMVDLGADVCVAFFQEGARNSGTRDCVARAKTAGIPVHPYPKGAA
jgi:hypothetical protein